MNIGVVLAFDYLIAPNTGLGYALGAVQLAAAALTAYTAVRLLMGARPMTLPERSSYSTTSERQKPSVSASGRM